MAVVGCRLVSGFAIEHDGKVLTLVGAAGPQSEDGAGLTFGVDADWFTGWLGKVGADFAPVTSGAIFMQKDTASVKAQAKDHAKRKTGFEPLSAEGNVIDGKSIAPDKDVMK